MKPGALWPIAIVGVLAVTVAANGYLLIRANDGSMTIEPDYYRKAVLWDSTMAQAARNVALGWTIDARLDRDGVIHAMVLDRAGEIVLPSTLQILGFPVGGVGGEFNANVAAGAGNVRIETPLLVGALYEVRFDAHRGPDRFTAVLRGRPGGRLVAP